MTENKYNELHSQAWQGSEFVESVVAASGLEPASRLWAQLALPGKSLLEVGPGSGHLLAAARQAGHSVTAVESSEVNRKFIHDTWGIDSVYPEISALPPGTKFDAVVAINVIEHVYDIKGFLDSIANALAPNGTFYMSTANAASLEASLLGPWWAMCKVKDHVALPSLTGVVKAAHSVGLRTERVWSSELPFELAISTLVAARDWRQSRHANASYSQNGHVVGDSGNGEGTPAKGRLASFYSLGARFDPSSRLLAALGRAGSVKARLVNTRS
jgi:2-polyprenyl-3-methyl-5-hydroxy-6-metoxy-1,4-benzoquinol methylase